MSSEWAYLKVDPWWLVKDLRKDKDMQLHLHEMFRKVNVGIATVTAPNTLQQDAVLKSFITKPRGQGTTMPKRFPAPGPVRPGSSRHDEKWHTTARHRAVRDNRHLRDEGTKLKSPGGNRGLECIRRWRAFNTGLLHGTS